MPTIDESTDSPTLAPTKEQVTEVTWSTTLPMNDISAADISDDDKDSILAGIAACSDNTDVDDLEITSVTDV